MEGLEREKIAHFVRKTIICEFGTGERKAYWATGDVKKNDLVAIMTQKKKIKVIKVVQVDQIPPGIQKAQKNWIIQKIELNIYYERMKTLRD